jgi:hypothetical protein
MPVVKEQEHICISCEGTFRSRRAFASRCPTCARRVGSSQQRQAQPNLIPAGVAPVRSLEEALAHVETRLTYAGDGGDRAVLLILRAALQTTATSHKRGRGKQRAPKRLRCGR